MRAGWHCTPAAAEAELGWRGWEAQASCATKWGCPHKAGLTPQSRAVPRKQVYCRMLGSETCASRCPEPRPQAPAPAGHPRAPSPALYFSCWRAPALPIPGGLSPSACLAHHHFLKLFLQPHELLSASSSIRQRGAASALGAALPLRGTGQRWRARLGMAGHCKGCFNYSQAWAQHCHPGKAISAG